MPINQDVSTEGVLGSFWAVFQYQLVVHRQATAYSNLYIPLPLGLGELAGFRFSAWLNLEEAISNSLVRQTA